MTNQQATPAKIIKKDSPEYAAQYAKMKAAEAASEYRLNAPWRYYEQTHPGR